MTWLQGDAGLDEFRDVEGRIFLMVGRARQAHIGLGGKFMHPMDTVYDPAIALSSWEDDGGSLPPAAGLDPGPGRSSLGFDEDGEAPTARHSANPGDRGQAVGLPSLPPGYEARPAGGFPDRTGRLFYEFHRVRRAGVLAPTERTDEDLSYWMVIWSAFRGSDYEHLTARWMSYARARELWGTHLTFERFASPDHMRDEVAELLYVCDVLLEPRTELDEALTSSVEMGCAPNA